MAKYIAKVSRGTFKNSEGVEKTAFVQIGRAVDHSTGGGQDLYLDFQPAIINGIVEKVNLFLDAPRQREDWDGSSPANKA